MRFTVPMYFLVLVLGASCATAQVKDGDGNALKIGQPIRPTTDFDGGRIGKGRPAKCSIDNQDPQLCTYYPRNGDGSFAIDVAGDAYYGEKNDPAHMLFDYDNGARMVPLGSFSRSKSDKACWVGENGRKICVY